MQETFRNSNELICKEIKVGKKSACIVYLLGLCDTIALSKFVISPLVNFKGEIKNLESISTDIIYLSEVEKQDSEKEIISKTGHEIIEIEKENIPYIFNKFYQVEPSRSNNGNGLGLALVKGIIDLIDAKIEVESEINEGTTFKVILN